MLKPLLLVVGVAGCSAIEGELPEPLPEAGRAVAAAYTHTVIATAGGAVAFHGTEVPRPMTNDNPDPLELPAATAVAVGRIHACALAEGGSVHCWGDHTTGALGEHRACTPPPPEGGVEDCVLGAEIMPMLPPARALVAGNDVTCATTIDDQVVCWGAAGTRLGGSRLPANSNPTPVMADGAVLAADRVIISHNTVCAIDLDARLWCWGDGYGATPVRQPQTGVRDVAIGSGHTCMIDDTGLACWGDNRNGQVGATEAARACGDGPCTIDTPHAIALPADQVVVGERHTCVRSPEGQVVCWGSNEVRQLGHDDAFLVGGPHIVLDGVAELAAGFAHTCARRADASVWCWGATTVRDPSLGVR